jgi:hypothetical protein
MATKALNLDVVRQLALKLPNVEDASSPRGAGFKVRGRLLACQAIHESAEPNSLMVRVSPEERARLLDDNSEVYYVTEHYSKHPAVLVRLSRVTREALRDLLGMAWMFVSEKAESATGASAKGSQRASRKRRPRKRPR